MSRKEVLEKTGELISLRYASQYRCFVTLTSEFILIFAVCFKWGTLNDCISKVD